MRTSSGATRHPVSIRLRGRLVDRLAIDGTAWTWYKFNSPEHERARSSRCNFELKMPPGTRARCSRQGVGSHAASEVARYCSLDIATSETDG